MAARRSDVAAFVSFEADGWNRVGDAYHGFFGPITARAVEPLLDAAAIGPGTRVLDAATGPGYAAARAAARGATVTGVDVAGEMLPLARQLAPEATFRLADAHELPFDEASFDAVVANFLVPHLADHEQAVGELVRTLAHSGHLALSTWDHPQHSRLLGAFADALQLAGARPPADLPAGPGMFRYADDAAFTELLRGAGLAHVAVHHIGFTQRLPSADALWEGVLGGAVRIAAVVRGQSPDMQRRIRRAFDETLQPHREGDHLEIPVSVKIATGRHLAPPTDAELERDRDEPGRPRER